MKKIVSLLRDVKRKLFPSQEQIEYAYLAESVDLVDLENRMRRIESGYFRQNWPVGESRHG